MSISWKSSAFFVGFRSRRAGSGAADSGSGVALAALGLETTDFKLPAFLRLSSDGAVSVMYAACSSGVELATTSSVTEDAMTRFGEGAAHILPVEVELVEVASKLFPMERSIVRHLEEILS